MIKFFKKMRQKMLAENKLIKYLIYAVGEIVLVVVGILIALWFNKLNYEKQQRIEEISMLKSLKSDFLKDKHDFKLNIYSYNAISYSADIILNALESSAVYNDSLDSYFAGTTFWPTSIIHTNSFDVLKSKGFDLISNDSLRDEILHFHGQIYTSIKTFENQYNRVIYFDEIIKRFNKVEPWYYGKDGKIYLGLMKPLNYNALKTDTLYLSILKTMKRDSETIRNSDYYTLIEDLENLVVNIDKELANLE